MNSAKPERGVHAASMREAKEPMHFSKAFHPWRTSKRLKPALRSRIKSKITIRSAGKTDFAACGLHCSPDKVQGAAVRR